MSDKSVVIVFSQDTNILLQEWRKTTGAKLWRFTLCLKDYPLIPHGWNAVPTVFNANDLPGISALIRYLHTSAGLPVRSTWIAAITAGDCLLWPCFPFDNVAKNYPVLV